VKIKKKLINGNVSRQDEEMEMKEKGLVYRIPVQISIYSCAPGASPHAAPNQARRFLPKLTKREREGVS
jgi:hypothetical protein